MKRARSPEPEPEVELVDDVLKLIIQGIQEKNDLVTLIRLKSTCQKFATWLQDVRVDDHMLENAIEHGHLDVVQRIHETIDPALFELALPTWTAVEFGQLEILKWLHSEEIPLEDTLCFVAARYGHLRVLRWLYYQGLRLEEDVGLEAARAGQVNILKWIHRIEPHFIQDNRDMVIAAASNGQLPVLKWLKKKRYLWFTSGAGAEAAGAGHIHILDWAHQMGCYLDSRMTAKAAQWGQFETLVWLRERNCPWDCRTHRRAEENREWWPDIYEYVVLCGCPVTEEKYECGISYGGS